MKGFKFGSYSAEHYENEGGRSHYWLRVGRFMLEISGPWVWSIGWYLDASCMAVNMFRYTLEFTWWRT